MTNHYPDVPLHDNGGIETLYFICVLFSGLSYLSMFYQVYLIPFQVMKWEQAWGPKWFYVILILWLNVEYFLWPLEMSEYLYRPNAQKINFVTDQNQYDEWLQRSLIWGSITGGFGFILIIFFLSLRNVPDYIDTPWFYVLEMFSYCF